MRRTRRPAGFTLLEVMIALVILSGIVLVMAASSGKHLSTTSRSRQRMQASVAADARIAMVRMSPVYDSLAARLAGTEPDTPAPGWTRTTVVARSGAGTTADLTRVTVSVSGPGLTSPIQRSTTIAAP